MAQPLKLVVQNGLLSSVFLFILSSSIVFSDEPLSQECRGFDNLNYICGPKSVEDLYHISGTSWIIGSGMGSPGNLYLINSDKKEWSSLEFGLPNASLEIKPEYYECPSVLNEKSFSPHGINLRIGLNGKHTLYVVNHGERESIEIFELNIRGKIPSLSWVGCIVIPKNISANSVTPLPGNGLAITKMYDPTDNQIIEKLNNAAITGEVLEWFPKVGWQRVPKSGLSGNNGLEVSKKGNWLYITGWSGRTFTRLSREKGINQKQTINLNFKPDNIRWTEDGSLFIAGHRKASDDISCDKKLSSCPLDSTIIKVDPDTLKITKIKDIKGTALFHSASVAVQVKDEIFVGTYTANRIAYFTVD